MSNAFPESAEPITLYRRIMRNSRKEWERRQKDCAPERRLSANDGTFFLFSSSKESSRASRRSPDCYCLPRFRLVAIKSTRTPALE